MSHLKNLGLVLLLIIGAISCQPTNESLTQEVPEWAFDPSLENKVDSLVGLLTLEEKVALSNGSGKFWSKGVERLGVDEVQYADGPLGIREELQRDSWAPAGWDSDSASFFPAGGGLSAAWSPELAFAYGECIGAEARARNKDYLLSPAINIIRTPLNGRNYEYMSEDPFLIGKLAAPYVQGIQTQDVASCVKHYAVNNQETDRDSIDALVDERTLREIYLPGFKTAVQEGQAYSVMGAYNRFRGDYLCENKYMLRDILKGEWGFQGTVVSDWGAAHSTVESAINGLDVEMGTNINGYENWYMSQALLDSVKSGAVPEEIVDEIAKRVMRVLLNVKKTDKTRKKGVINVAKHRQFMYDCASESIVLLKNENNVLPLNEAGLSSMAVIGANAKQKHAAGGFGAGVKVQYEVSPLEGLQSRLPNTEIKFAQGYQKQFLPGDEDQPEFARTPDSTPNQELITEAVEVAKNSDVAVVFGGTNRIHESESTDRKDMQLPYGQVELIKAVAAANPKTVVVLVVGTIFDLSEIKAAAPSVMISWFNGSEAGNAVADVLLGRVNPSGKLPFTIPAKLEDSPAHATNSFPGDGYVVSYEEGLLVGYRWFDTKNVEPLYPFGYGISYSSYDYGNASADKATYTADETISVTVKVNNSGNVDGKEIVQLYVEDVESSLERPKKELKGFSKVLLAKGESKEVTIEVPVSSLAFFDDKNMQWVVEPGEFKFHVGASSRDIKSTISVMVK